MYNIIEQFKTEIVEVSLTGNSFYRGTIVEIGNDIIVLYDGQEFIYIPNYHIENISLAKLDVYYIQSPSTAHQFYSTNQSSTLTLESVLKDAVGMYLEIFVAKNHSLHGTIMKVLNDYIVFHSPIYKTIYIPIKHIKWIIPYADQEKPFNLSEEELQQGKNTIQVGTQFIDLIHKLKNKLVMLNLGEKHYHYGKIANVNGDMIEFIIARSGATYVNIHHIKTIHEV